MSLLTTTMNTSKFWSLANKNRFPNGAYAEVEGKTGSKSLLEGTSALETDCERRSSRCNQSLFCKPETLPPLYSATKSLSNSGRPGLGQLSTIHTQFDHYDELDISRPDSGVELLSNSNHFPSPTDRRYSYSLNCKMAAEQQPKLLKDSQPDTLATLELELNNFRVDQSPKKAIGQLQAASRVEGSYDIPSVTLPRPFNSSRKSRAQPNTSRELQIPSFQPQDFKIPPDLRSSWSWQVQNRRAEAFVGPPFPQHMYPPYAQPYNTFMPMGLTVPTFLSDERPNSELTQCALLQEFRHGSRARRFELRDIYGHVVEFSSDQQGSRFIQARLETASTEEKYKIFMEIQDNALALMTDVFGNYVIQKFFEHGDQTHKRLLCRAMRGHVLSLTLQMYGCRVVQKALEHVLVDQQAAIVRELEGNVLKCVRDQNGNHVIQKAIERCQPQLLASIINSFRGHAQQLSNHTYGCRVIQRLLERTEGQRTHIMDELTTSIPQMIEDQFGNYVVQHLVQYDPNHGRVMVMHIVLAQLEQLSKAKFASNVVEKCLVEGDERFRINVLARLLGNLRLLASLVQDRVGNYVIQKLIETLNEDGFHTFVHHLQPVMMQTRRLGGYEKPIASIGKKITARLSRQSYSNVLFS